MALLSDKQLEQLWVKYQFDVAGLRGSLGPLYNMAFHARQAHTFNVDQQPKTVAVHATMGPTKGEPLAELPNDQGSYDRVELHVLRIGQDAFQRAGLTGAPIRVTIQRTFPSDLLDTLPPEDVIISDGVARTASSINSNRVLNVNPERPPTDPAFEDPQM